MVWPTGNKRPIIFWMSISDSSSKQKDDIFLIHMLFQRKKTPCDLYYSQWFQFQDEKRASLRSSCGRWFCISARRFVGFHHEKKKNEKKKNEKGEGEVA